MIAVDGAVGVRDRACASARRGSAIPRAGIEPWRDTGRRGARARRSPTSSARSPRPGPRPGTRCRRRRARRPRRHGAASRRRRRCASSRPCRTRPGCSASTSSSRRWPATRCGSPTRTSPARRPTCRRCARPRATASTCGCSCPARPTFPLLRPFSRAGYRPLLEAGVRVFEWNGSMLHAKTAVADGRWARVGSTNLNIASWMGNCELDVDRRGRARSPAQMEEMFLADLDQRDRGRARRAQPRASAPPAQPRRASRAGARGGSGGRVMAGAVRIGNTVTRGDHEPPRARARRGAHRLISRACWLASWPPRASPFPAPSAIRLGSSGPGCPWHWCIAGSYSAAGVKQDKPGADVTESRTASRNRSMIALLSGKEDEYANEHLLRDSRSRDNPRRVMVRTARNFCSTSSPTR